MDEPGVTLDGASDEALLAGMASGDNRAATLLVRRYQKRVFGLAYSVLGDSAGAEEVAQEALLRVWRHAAVFDPRRGAVSSWILTITRNLAIDALRMRRSLPVDPDDFVGLAMLSADHGPEEAALAADAAPAVRAALAALPEEQRRALVLAAVFGRTAAEISESEQIPLGTAKTRIRAGLQKMRAALVDREGSRTEWMGTVNDDE
jgi:RNA polymerase sigma-70 factor (ECF subfamily)